MGAPDMEQRPLGQFGPNEAVSESISVGPDGIHVDTGNNWLDLGFVVVLIIVTGWAFRRWWIKAS